MTEITETTIFPLMNYPLFYISLTKNIKTEEKLKKQGFTNVVWFPAINGKELNLEELARNQIISQRTFNDIKLGRHEHSGVPTLGVIGCYLSHREVWKLIIKNNIDKCIVCEEDIHFTKPLSNTNKFFIENSIKEENTICLSPNSISKNTKLKYDFNGTQFYVLRKSTANTLLKYSLPIDIQVDFYIAYLGNINLINIILYETAKQTAHSSSIQKMCIKCNLPEDNLSYFCFLIIILSIILLFFIARKYTNNKLL